MNDGRRIAVTIPAFDAAPSIADVVRRTFAVLPDVLVIDDGSSDGTGRAAAEAGARVITHPENLGKGCALRTAFDTLFGEGFDAVITIDADGQHLPEEIPALFAAPTADLVLGTREQLFREMCRMRRTSNRMSSWAISCVAGKPLLDVQTGFRLYTRRLIEVLGFPPGRFEPESSIVVRAVRAGFEVASVPIRLGFADGRCTSHYRPVVDSLRIAKAVIRARHAERV